MTDGRLVQPKPTFLKVAIVTVGVSMVAFALAFSVHRLKTQNVIIGDDAVACNEVVAIGVRESGSPAGAEGNFGRTGGSTRSALKNQLRGKRSIATYGLDYPALSTETITKDLGKKYFAGVDLGTERLSNAIEKIGTGCRSWIVLVGYSQGALVIRKTLPRLSENAASRIAGVALLGDPSRAPNDGTSHFGEADENKKGLYETVVSRTPAIPRLSGPALSWCNRGDAICASDAQQLVEMLIQSDVSGGNATPHGRYLENGSARKAGVDIAGHLKTLDRRPPQSRTPER